MPNTLGSVIPRVYVWENRVLYSGPSFIPRYRCYGSAALVVSLHRPLKLHRRPHGSRQVTTEACLIEPGLPTYIDCDGSPLAVLFLDPLRRDLEMLRNIAGEGCDGLWYRFRHARRLQEIMIAITEQGPPPERALELLTGFGLPPGHRVCTAEADPRIIHSMDLIRRFRGANITTETLAVANNLSVPRIVQLFRRNLGVSAGRYRQWHRLHASVLAIASGQTFTQAALGAGFSDLAHFSNTFSSMLGVPPSQPLRCHGKTQYHVNPELAATGFTPMTLIKDGFRSVC